MSLLDYYLAPERIVIFADTLVIAEADHSKHKFASKIFPIPHLNGVLCGTGDIDFILDWFISIQKCIVTKDFDFVNDNAPKLLRELWKDYVSGQTTTTVYHFAFSPKVNRLMGHAFRSTAQFDKEEMQDGFGIKPGDQSAFKLLTDYIERGAVPDQIEIAELQKKLDDEKKPMGNVGIGGTLHICEITEFSQFMWQCYMFDDYEESFREMLINLELNKRKMD